MADPRIHKLAQLLEHYSTHLQPGDRVMMRGFPLEPVAEPLVRAVIREVLRAGGYPHLRMTPSGYLPLYLSEANNDSLNA